MSENQSWCWMESGGDSAGQRSEEDEQVGDSGEVKQLALPGVGEVALYVMVASLKRILLWTGSQ